MDSDEPSPAARSSRRLPGPSEAAVGRIVDLSDPLVRNLQITQAYHELSAGLAQRTGPLANWCTFATWASKQAGQTIRQEDLARQLERALGCSPGWTEAFGRFVAAARRFGARRSSTDVSEAIRRVLDPETAFDRASDAVARGNLKVFAEIGLEFARFLETLLDDADYDGSRIATFCDRLRSGDPPDGQQYLRLAFPRYYRALFEPDPRAKVEMLLLANLEIGVHEQTRLQPEIAEALDAGFDEALEIKHRVLEVVLPGAELASRARGRVSLVRGRPTPLEAALDRVVTEWRARLREILTAHMMTFTLPDGTVLRLGRNLRLEYPASLGTIEDRDLRALLARVDPTPDSLEETGAADWADLDERLHYIADLFRGLADWRPLLDPPFSPDQVAALKEDRRPAGRL